MVLRNRLKAELHTCASPRETTWRQARLPIPFPTIGILSPTEGPAMKLLVNRAALVEALGLASSVVLSRTPKPVLTCVKLVAGTGSGGTGAKTLTVVATDMELALQYTLTQVDIATPGVALIPAGKLSEIVNNSPDDTLTLENTADTTAIKGSDAQYKVFGYNAEEFPPITGFEGPADFSLSA